MNGTETDLLRQILLEVQALSLGNIPADNSVTTAKIVDDNVTEAKLSSAFKRSLFNTNYLKNPNFAVIQGTASGTVANSLALPTASLGYQGETEWCIAAAGGTPAYAFSALDERVTFTGAASTTAIYLLQRLESLDTNRLKNKTVTFSCEISNSLLTSVIWEVFRPTTTDDIHGTIATPTQTLIASGTFTVSSTLTRYSATFALPDLASRGLEIRLRVGAQTSGTWVVSRLQLEEGSIATDFNCGDYVDELRTCQRYFQYAGTSFAGATFGATLIEISVYLENRMRTNPVVSNRAGFVFATRYNGGDLSITSPTTQNISSTVFGIWLQIVTTGLTSLLPIASRFNSASANFLEASAHIP